MSELTGYEDPAWATDYVLEELGLADAPKSLEFDLEDQAGTKPNGTKVFRPDLYISRYLAARKGLASGEGAVFRVEQRVKAYLQRQADRDRALSLTVPPGTEAVVSARGSSFSGSVPIVVSW